VVSPTYAARQAAALDRISDGRFLVNIVAGGNPVELAADGVHLSHDARYEHAAEFLTVFNALLEGRKVTLEGAHVKVKDAELGFLPVQKPRPPVWLAGRPTQASRSPPNMSTSISPGASRSIR
jgi:alkanesulfonate monooxygenase